MRVLKCLVETLSAESFTISQKIQFPTALDDKSAEILAVPPVSPVPPRHLNDSRLTCVQVPPDLQNEVLMSLLETDPDVVDYLLRRKASQ